LAAGYADKPTSDGRGVKAFRNRKRGGAVYVEGVRGNLGKYQPASGQST
jgi:hypothetical protein